MATSPLRRLVPVVALTALIAGAASDAAAQGFVSPLIGYDYGGDSGCRTRTECEDKSLNFGIAFGKLGVIGFEQEIAYARDFFGDVPGESSGVLTVMSNLLVAPTIGFVTPYGLFGIGLMKAHADFQPTTLLSLSNNSAAWDIGAGVIVWAGPVGVRGDIRHFHSFRSITLPGLSLEDAKLDYSRASGALVFRF